MKRPTKIARRIGDAYRQGVERQLMSEQILFLQRQIKSERKLNLALMKQLEEKDRQIAMVLERHYEQPVIRPAGPIPEATVRIDPATLDDAPRFDAEADKKQREKEEKEFEDASRKLDDELNAAFQEVAVEVAAAVEARPAVEGESD